MMLCTVGLIYHLWAVIICCRNWARRRGFQRSSYAACSATDCWHRGRTEADCGKWKHYKYVSRSDQL